MPVTRAPTRHAELSPKSLGGSWSQERRLEFIDYRLRWDGRLNRSDLIDFFGISVPQASLDIAKYAELAPHNIAYDRRERAYFSATEFQPLYPTGSPQRYLNDLLAQASGLLGHGMSFLGWRPPVAIAPTPTRTISTKLLIALIGTMRRGRALSMTYQSMTSPGPKDRLISPKALGHDGFRWHVRAYCHREASYRDFVIARMLSIGNEQDAPSETPEDVDWNTTVTLILEPNPGLAEPHRRVIELDYGMEDGQVRLECRRALLLYVMRNLGLDDISSKSPKAQQVVLRNWAEIEPFLPSHPDKSVTSE